MRMTTRRAGMTAMSETMKNAALRLQGVPGMKSTIVGLLAVIALGGCGVGVDDPEGQQAAAGTTAAAIVEKVPSAQPDFARPHCPDPHTALPQDPIPTFEGKQGPEPTPTPEAKLVK